MADTKTGTVLSEIKFDGVVYRTGDKLEAPKDTIRRLIRIGVVEDPAVKAAADKEANSGTEAAEAKAQEVTETAESEADEKAKTVTEEAIAEADKLVADAKVEAEKIVKDAQEAAKAPQTNKTAAASR